MAHLKKKTWTTPEVTQFQTLEELLGHYRKNLPHSKFDELVERTKQLQQSVKRSAERSELRKSIRK